MSAKGARIRRARAARGWTQAELARQAGVSQPLVSAVERGGVASGKGLAAILAVLAPDLTDLDHDRASPAPTPQPDWLPAVVYGTLPLPLAVDAYVQPHAGGDFAAVIPLGREVLIACVDVGGHGLAALPAAAYLQGWLRGYLAALGAGPRLSHLAEKLDGALAETGIEAAWFLALIEAGPSAPPHTVTYTAMARGFPRPLLLGRGAATLPALPEKPGEPVHHVLEAPWTLVAATDGLLRRLGAGSEEQGRVKLRHWQRGSRRLHTASVRLAPGAAGADDELAFVVRWDGWDRIERLLAGDHVIPVHRVKRTLFDDAERHVGVRRARALGAAVSEAIDNVREHAYGGEDGTLVVRWRREGAGFRVEVEDAGSGAIAEADGFAVMRGHADEVEWFAGSDGGTVVSIAVRGP